jgi:hypothetical protein
MDPIQLPGSHANAAKHLYHRTGLSLALAPRKIPNLKYLDPITTVETWVILKITQYGFRSSLKIWSSFLDWTQKLILMFEMQYNIDG